MTEPNDDKMMSAPTNALDRLLAGGTEPVATNLISKQPDAMPEIEAQAKKRAAAKPRSRATTVELTQAQRDIPHQKRLSDMIAAQDAKSRKRRAENQARRASNIPRTGQR